MQLANLRAIDAIFTSSKTPILQREIVMGLLDAAPAALDVGHGAIALGRAKKILGSDRDSILPLRQPKTMVHKESSMSFSILAEYEFDTRFEFAFTRTFLELVKEVSELKATPKPRRRVSKR